MKSRALRLWVLGYLSFTAMMMGNRALAESYFRVSPGPLNQSHAAYDNSEGCPACHESAKGVPNQKCLACHPAIAHKNGLHASFGGKSCIACHAEHKGRSYSIIDWKTVGGRDTFKHEVTGFSRTHHHAQVACTQCHVRRLKTGHVSYLGLSRDCQSCHRGAHGLKRPELAKRCETCHEPGQPIRAWTLAQWKTPHAQYSRLALEGKHLDQLCTKCHQKGMMGGRSTPRKCADCHAPPHPVTDKMATCARCHAQSRPFRGVTVNHTQFGFELLGKHRTTRCRNCHVRKGKPIPRPRGSSRSCLDCHSPAHPLARETRNCIQCHASGGSWKGATLDHAKVGFALLGKHHELQCRSCHKPRTELGYREGDCTSCHAHRQAHQGQFADKPCASCHIEGGKRSRPFDHDRDTRFPLIGFHKTLGTRSQCAGCHPGSIYRTGKTACVDCHQDKHRGELGKDCTQCHTPLLRFDASRSKDFPHTAFPLEGKHRTVACRSCHPGGRYKTGKHACVDCHLKDDVHRGKLGRNCGKCHVPAKGAPKFNHERMTRFPRTGAHKNADCSLCHQRPSRVPAALTVAQWKVVAKKPLDRRFPVRGVRCADCHADPHRGYVGTSCGQCHTATSFHEISGARARVVRPLDHAGVWLRRHTALPVNDREPGAKGRSCAVCHGTPSCRHCHRTHAPRSHTALWRLKTHGSVARFDPGTCRVCHQTWSCIQCHRTTAPLSHRGTWRTTHGYVAGGFASDSCFVCHRRADCARCHPGG